MLLIFLVFLLSYYVSLHFLVLCCAVHYYFRIKTMLSSSLPPLVSRTHVLFMLFVFVVYSGVQHILTVYMSNTACAL